MGKNLFGKNQAACKPQKSSKILFKNPVLDESSEKPENTLEKPDYPELPSEFRCNRDNFADMVERAVAAGQVESILDLGERKAPKNWRKKIKKLRASKN